MQLMPSRVAQTDLFDKKIRANEADLLAYFQRRTPNGADAADAFGELLLIAWKQRVKIPSEAAAARMWLFGAARNVLQNQRRSTQRASEAVQRLADTMRVLVPEFSSDEDSVMLRAAIQDLPPEDAELMRLVYWDGFRSHEAAAILGLNASTARSRIAKSLGELRRVLVVDVVGSNQ